MCLTYIQADSEPTAEKTNSETPKESGNSEEPPKEEHKEDEQSIEEKPTEEQLESEIQFIDKKGVYFKLTYFFFVAQRTILL
jgi:hypothetical protein